MSYYRQLLCLLTIIFILSGCNLNSKNDLSTLSAPELLTTAKQAIEESDYQKGLDYLREIEARFPYSAYARQAVLETAYLHYKRGDNELTVATADRFIHTYPTHEGVDYAYYLKGLANFATHRNFISRLTGSKDFSDRDPLIARDSFDAFQELVNRFPDSVYTPDAIERMKKLLNTLAKHETNIARFYLKRGAYVAVLNRCKQVLNKYENTPAAEDALGMMVIAYREMSLPDLARDTWRVLQTNFPDSRYLTELNNG